MAACLRCKEGEELLEGVYSVFGARSWGSKSSKKRSRDHLFLEESFQFPYTWPEHQKKSRSKRTKLHTKWSSWLRDFPIAGSSHSEGVRRYDSGCRDGKLEGVPGEKAPTSRQDLPGRDRSLPWDNPTHSESSTSGLVAMHVEPPPRWSRYKKATPKHSALKKSEMGSRKRVQFKEGSLGEKYGTDDGHPIHDGRKVLQVQVRGSGGSPSKKRLTWKKIQEVEVLLSGTCEPSLKRLRRRAGLEPLRVPDLKYVTSPKKRGVEQTP